MCTLAIYVRAFSEFPIVIAANRDEFLSRPTSSPGLLDRVAGIFGGRDEVAGGTWLGVNRFGVAAALLNRRSALPADPARRSRGRLCLAMLQAPSASEARRAVERELPGTYNPFNLLITDAEHAWIANNHGDVMTVTELPPGLHLLTNLDLDDPTCPRIAASVQLFAALLGPTAPPPASAGFHQRLRRILSTHDTPLDPRAEGAVGNSLCLHAAGYGTRSSSLVYYDSRGRWTYLHTNQPPCRSDYQPQPVMELLSEATSAANRE